VSGIRRREFLLLGGIAAAWPVAARAQQPAMPVIGVLTSMAAGDAPQLLVAFRQGLKDTGFVEDKNVRIEYRFAGNQNERLPGLAADLVHNQVAAIAALTTPAGLAAKAATATIPIVFTTAANPVRLGLVASLNRPGGNVTGVTILLVETASKRLELLHELIPAVSTMALLVNPANATLAQANESEVRAAAESLGLKLHILGASTEADLDGVFAKVIELRLGGLVIGGDPFFTARQEQLATLAVRYAVRRSTKTASSSRPAASSAMAAALPTLTAWPASMPPDFSRAKSPASCRCSSPRKLRCSSTSRPLGRSASPCRCHCLAAPTR